MERITAKYDDQTRALWGHGVWQNEDDLAAWTDEATGYACVVSRDPDLGYFCGYVVLPPGHVLNGLQFSDPDFPEEVEGSCHGGVNASDDGLYFLHGIRPHLTAAFPYQAAPGDWVVGFHCLHWRDKNPRFPFPDTTYRDQGYVEGECRKLAAALKAAETEAQDG